MENILHPTNIPTTNEANKMDRNSLSVYNLSDALYNGTAGQGTPKMVSSADTITDSFYNGNVNPMYDFDSPYITKDYSSNYTAEPTNGTCDEVTVDTVEVNPRPVNDQLMPRAPYGMNDVGQVSNMYYGPYTYNNLFLPYDNTEAAFTPGSRSQNPRSNGSILPPLQPNVSIEQVEFPINITRGYYNREAGEVGQRSVFTARSTPSATSEDSPLQPEAVYVPTGGNAYFTGNHGNQAEVYEDQCNTVTPKAIKNRYNPGYYTYNTHVPNDGDVYLQTYMNTSCEGVGKPQECCYTTWKDCRYQNYMASPTFNIGQEYMDPRHQTIQAEQYAMPPTPYPGNIMYNVEGRPLNGYVYDGDNLHNYPNVNEEGNYYSTGAGYVAIKGNGYMDDAPHNPAGDHSLSLRKQKSHHSQRRYDGNYSQSSVQEGFFSPQPTVHPSPRAAAAIQEYDDGGLELAVENQDGGAPKLSIDTLKNINRSEIDFLRMSDTVWQTLRSTGLFKLGNKGRAVLKSKISKQLKLNPKLRMRALCISGVRRATTRQLYQLAQVCGIKSHLK